MASGPKRRGDKRERTRAALIAAALAELAEKGFAGASLEGVAQRAGVTRGAIYSNFENREDLFTAAVGAQGMSLDRDFSRRLPLSAQLRRFAENLVDEFPAGARDGSLIVEYQLHAMSQPALRARLAVLYEAMFAKIAADLAAQYEAELTIPPHALALAIQALAMGLVWQFMLTPAAVRRADVLAAFAALARGAAKSGASSGA